MATKRSPRKAGTPTGRVAKGILEASLKEEAERKERLRQALPAAAELLRTRQAGLIAAREIEEFIALNWLEWHGGSLKLTVTGSNIVSQSRANSIKLADQR